MAEAGCIIEDLLKNPFSRMSFTNKDIIVKAGRPCPELPNLLMKHKDKKNSFTRHFNVSQYEKIPWLTGSSTLSRLFCWPCLLFSTEKSVWAGNGYANLNNLTNAVHKHQQSVSHHRAFVQLKQFGTARIDLQLNEQLRISVAHHNETVRKNREILKRLIDSVCFLANQELPFRGHNEEEDSLNKGNYVELLNYLRIYDPILHAHLQNATVFQGTSNRIQNDLIHSIGDVLSTAIKAEVTKSSFVAILLDETSDIMNLSQLSTTLRYVHNTTGQVHERFLSFTDVSADRSANGLLTHVKQVVEEYNLKDKLIAQAYDGAAVMAGHINGLRAKVQELYPSAIFVHCFSHMLNLVLSQSTSNIRECRIFFQTLAGLGAFFTKSSKRTHALSEFTQKKMPRNAPTRWNFSSRLVFTAKENRPALLGFFNSVLHEDFQNWDNDTVLAAQGFINFFSGFQTLFLLLLFSRVFAYTDVLFNILQTQSLDIVYCSQKIQETKTALEKERDKFDEVWSDTESEIEVPQLRRQQEDPKLVFRRLYYDIIDNVTMQLNERFGSLHQLGFTALLNPKNYESYNRNFPQASFEKLKETYKDVFDFLGLKNELIVLYSSQGFDKHPSELVKFMRQEEYHTGMTEVYKLGTLVLTVPSTTASVERSFSALKRIKSYQRATQGQDRLSELGLISIEKQLLHQLRQSATFYDDVITIFLKKERRMELIYK